MENSVIYLDNNATTRVAPEVIEAMLPFLYTKWGNPSSIHRFGGSVHSNVEEAREAAAQLIGAQPHELFFTSCGSESDNMALKGFFALHGSRTRIVTSSVEHPAVRSTARYLQERGATLVELDVDAQGCIDPAVFDDIPLDEHTIVSMMWANNETGVLFPIEEIAAKVKAAGAVMHCDAVQIAGKLPVDMSRVPVDMLALSGHKLHAPKGIGLIYIRSGTRIDPLIHGGHQERGLRAGTENVPWCVGLGVACTLAMKHFADETGRVRLMRDRLEKELLARCASARLNGHPDKRLPNTTNISFENIEGESILLLLDEYGIAASSGSACTTGSLEPSHVMRAMGIPYTLAHSSTRFSLSRYTTDSDIDRVIEVMPGIVDKLRGISPFVQGGRSK